MSAEDPAIEESPLSGIVTMEAQALTNLIKGTGLSLNAATILSALRKTNLAEGIEYLSTSGSGEVKSFLRLTEAGQAYGTNKPTAHDFKTEARFYANRFADLLDIILEQLSQEITALRT